LNEFFLLGNYGDSAPNYCESRLDDEPRPVALAFHLMAAFDFRRQLVFNVTHTRNMIASMH
jgi:hypothetical protein